MKNKKNPTKNEREREREIYIKCEKLANLQ